MKISKKQLLQMALLLVIGIVCSVYFYSQLIGMKIPLHSDDAGSAVDMNNIYKMGGVFSTRNYINIFWWISYLLYKVFGSTEFYLQIFFVIKFLICIIFSLYFATSSENVKRINWYLIPLFIFMTAMPANTGDATIHMLKFHVEIIIYYFIFLFYYNKKNNNKFLLSLLLLIGIVCGDILLAVILWIPFFIYKFIELLKSGYLKKNYKYILWVFMGFLIIGRFFFKSFEYSGYGTRVFSSISEIGSNFILGLTGILNMFNILILGQNIIQYDTILYLIRLSLFILGFIVAYQNIKILLKCKFDKALKIDYIVSLSIWITIIAYIFAGDQNDVISARYMSSLNYLIPILLCRKISRLEFSFNSEKTKIIKKYMVVTFMVLIFIFAEKIHLKREPFEMDTVASTIASKEELSNGIGGFWVANILGVLTSGKNQVQAVIMNSETMEPQYNIWEYYQSGIQNYNFIVEDKDEKKKYGVTSKNILKLYGKPNEKYSVEGRNIFVYDFDVRTLPIQRKYDDKFYLAYDEAVTIKNNSIQLKKNQKLELKHLYIPVGKERIKIKGRNFAKDISVSSEQDIDLRITQNTDKELWIEISSESIYTDVSIMVQNNSDDEIYYQNSVQQHLEDAIILRNENVESVSENYECREGLYNICLSGKDIKNTKMEIIQNDERLKSKRIKNGEDYIVYQVDIPQDGIIEISYANRNVQVCAVETPYTERIKLPKQYYDQTKILTNSKNKVTNKGEQILDYNELTFGPYVSLTAGTYEIEVNGKNLSSADIKCTGNAGKEVYEIEKIAEEENESIKFKFVLLENAKQVEIVVQNNSDESVIVNYYAICERME